MKKYGLILLIFTTAMLFCFLPGAFAHCDSLDGPVVIAAKAALDAGDVTLVLKWVKKEHETEVTTLFNKITAVRNKGQKQKELADMYFFETVVRLHRTGEGEPYTGLKPAGIVEPAVIEADKALESGSVDALVKLVTEASAKKIRERYAKAKETRKTADQSVEAGREYVEAYMQFTHYVERLHDAMAEAQHN